MRLEIKAYIKDIGVKESSYAYQKCISKLSKNFGFKVLYSIIIAQLRIKLKALCKLFSSFSNIQKTKSYQFARKKEKSSGEFYDRSLQFQSDTL